MSPAQDEGDDGFLELMEMEDDDIAPKPKLDGLDKLFNAPLLNQELEKTPTRYHKNCASPSLNSPAHNRPRVSQMASSSYVSSRPIITLGPCTNMA